MEPIASRHAMEQHANGNDDAAGIGPTGIRAGS